MRTILDELLSELERFGKANDDANAERPRRMLNITRDTGEFLAVLVRATVARRVLEIGTSNGYSTLWLARPDRAKLAMASPILYSESSTVVTAPPIARTALASHRVE